MGKTIRIVTHNLNGRTVGTIVEMTGLDGAATLQEAIDMGFVQGKKELLMGQISGVMKAALDGVKRDGDGRKIDGYLSINAWPKGRIADVTDEVAKSDIKVALRARMLKEFKVNPSNFTIVVEGSTGTFAIQSITTGETLGVIHLGEDVLMNGSDLAMGEGDGVSWTVPETGASGTVAPEFVTSDIGRITIARDGLRELFDAANDGKAVAFTVRIGGRKAVKSAEMKYVG